MPRTSRFDWDNKNIGSSPLARRSPPVKSQTVEFHEVVILVRKLSAISDDGCDSRKKSAIPGVVLLGCVVGQTESIRDLSSSARINEKI